MLRSVFALLLVTVCLPQVNSLNNGLALTPPMGWMSWTQFYCQIDCVHHPNACINEQLYQDHANHLINDGYKAVGYTSIHIDDCWLEKSRSADGKLVADRSRFPSGMAALADYMHKRGLKLAIYEDVGTKTCAGYPGSEDHYDVDAQTFADWNIDYLKFDNCNVDNAHRGPGFIAMRQALNKTGKPIVYSIEWADTFGNQQTLANYQAARDNSNLWRNDHDVQPKFSSIADIIGFYERNQDVLIQVNGPGGWNDPDMIVVGHPELSPDQARVQMSLWSIWSAPLIMSNDLRNIAPVYKAILQNKEVIAVDQDPMGVMGRHIMDTPDKIGIYVKPMMPMANNQSSYAVVFFNKNTASKTISITYGQLGLQNPLGYLVTELWSGQYLGVKRSIDSYNATVPATGVTMIKAIVLSSG